MKLTTKRKIKQTIQTNIIKADVFVKKPWVLVHAHSLYKSKPLEAMAAAKWSTVDQRHAKEHEHSKFDWNPELGTQIAMGKAIEAMFEQTLSKKAAKVEDYPLEEPF